MSRRSITLLVAGVLVLVLGAVGALLPVPYVVLSPGPTVNTLGEKSGKPLIRVKGHRTYPTDGHLNLTTVSYVGGPKTHMDLITVLRAWFASHDAVVPEEALFPPDETAQQVNQENVQAMTNSQESATAAALSELGIDYTTRVEIAGTVRGKPAHGRLKSGDTLLKVDSTKVTDPDVAAKRIAARDPGKPVDLTVDRGGTTKHVTVPTVASDDGKAMIGVTVRSRFSFPFDVTVSVGDIGGPSAGTMFALGMIDKLTPGDLTGGKFIAGTGEITPKGEVGPIGGIQQKMAGARSAGATVFLTPADNCPTARTAKPDGLRLVKITTLHQARTAIKALRTGNGSVPGCD